MRDGDRSRDFVDEIAARPGDRAAAPLPPAPGDHEQDIAPDHAYGTGSWWRRLLRLATVDVRPLRRHRDFRLLFMGQLVSFFGTMLTSVALPYQVYHITRSSLAVGLLGLVQLVPLLAFAFLGGALADAHDRRRMVQLTELAFAVMSGLLAANALLPYPHVWVLYAVAAAMAGLDALQRPSLDALLPRLVERDELTAAGALGSLRTTLGMVAGPALAGILIATIGLVSTYGLDVATFAVSLAALRLMRAAPPPPDAERPSLRRVVEGLRYARSRPDQTIWNQTIPDALRGRLASIELVSYSSGPLLGDVESGVVATAYGVPASVVSGGILCVIGVAALAVALPQFRRYDAR